MNECLCAALESMELWSASSSELTAVLETDVSSVLIEGVMVEQSMARALDGMEGFNSDEELESYLQWEEEYGKE